MGLSQKKIILLVVLIAGVAALIFTAKRTQQRIVAVENSAPDFKVTDATTGNTISSSELRGKVLFVNFWASWCQPCKDEMPSIENIYKSVSDGNFRMITILYKDTTLNAGDYMRAHGYTFPVFTDNDGLAAARFGVTGVPETYIIDKNGVLKRRVIGPADWNSPEEKFLIHSLLKG